MNFPLVHPSEIKRYISYDKELSKIITPSMWNKFLGKSISRLKRLCKIK